MRTSKPVATISYNTQPFLDAKLLELVRNKKIQDFVVNNVIHIEDFSSKKLFENPEKAKVTSTFEHNRKKVMKEFYNNISELCPLDAITIQEFND